MKLGVSLLVATVLAGCGGSGGSNGSAAGTDGGMAGESGGATDAGTVLSDDGGTQVSQGDGGGPASDGGGSPTRDGGSTSVDSGGTPPGPMGAACKVTAPAVTTPLADGAPVTATIHADTIVCTTSPDFSGTNFEAFPGWGADISFSTFQQVSFQHAGTSMFRYPGGEPGEWTDLLFTGTCMNGMPANYGSPPYTKLWAFAQTAGVGSLMLQTNPTPQYCGSGQQDASGTHAAAIAKDAASHGVSAVYEVGNEPEISGFFTKNGGQAAYIAKFIEHASAIHAAVSGSQVYGPVLCGLGGNCSFPTTWDSGWLGAFLAQTGNMATGSGKGTVDGISFHVYWHPEWAYSDLMQAKIDKYGFALYWSAAMMPYLRSLIAKYDSRNLPIAISEISLGNGIPNDSAQTQNMFSVLETLDTVGAFAVSGLRSFQWFDANAAGPSDFWMITPTAPRPLFYAFTAWAAMGRDMLRVDEDATPHDLAVYASRRADGTLAVLLINKTKTAHGVTLSFNGSSVMGRSMATTTLEPSTAAQDTATSVVYGGATNPAPTALPAPVMATAGASPTIQLAAYSAAIVTFLP
jgi:hypothetical protein